MVEDLALNRNLHLLCKALGTLRSQKECKSCRMGEEQANMSSGRYRPTELKIWRQLCLSAQECAECAPQHLHHRRQKSPECS